MWRASKPLARKGHRCETRGRLRQWHGRAAHGRARPEHRRRLQSRGSGDHLPRDGQRAASERRGDRLRRRRSGIRADDALKPFRAAIARAGQDRRGLQCASEWPVRRSAKRITAIACATHGAKDRRRRLPRPRHRSYVAQDGTGQSLIGNNRVRRSQRLLFFHHPVKTIAMGEGGAVTDQRSGSSPEDLDPRRATTA